MTNDQIATNVKDKLNSILKEIDEVFELEETWDSKEDWIGLLNKLRSKKYLLEELLGINE